LIVYQKENNLWMIGQPTFCLGCNLLKNHYCFMPKTILLENFYWVSWQ